MSTGKIFFENYAIIYVRMRNLFLRTYLFISRPHVRVLLFFVVAAVGFFVFSDSVFAQNAQAQNIVDKDWTDDIMLWLAELTMDIAQIIMKIVVALLDVLIEMLVYNGFGNSQVVAVGWSIVRDVVNLFFVAVLIIIAFGTILGVSRFNWVQQVPRLLIFAIVINFSKTLASLMVDIGQVVMLTFANAIKDIAAGNFIQMLGLTEIINISTTGMAQDATQSGSKGFEGFDLLASGIAAMLLVGWVAIVIFILVLIIAMRIVMIWVLIVLAPIAWFMGGAKGVVKSGAYEKWWEQFTCWVTVGPILTFFLWLALAVAGAGNIAVSENMVSTDTANPSSPSGLILSIFESHKLMSFIIGMAMIVAGFEAAGEACGSASGMLSGALKQARKGIPLAIGGAALASAKFGGKTAGKAALGTGKYLGDRVGRNVSEKLADTKLGILTKKGRARIFEDKARNAGGGIRALIYGKLADSSKKAYREKVKDTTKSFEGTSRATKVSYLESMAKGEKGPWDAKQKQRASAMLMEALGDKQQLSELEASGSLEGLWQKFGPEMKSMFAGDVEAMDKIDDFEKHNSHVTGAFDKVETMDDVRKSADRAFANTAFLEKADNINAGNKGKNGKFDSQGNVVYQLNTEALQRILTADEIKQTGIKKDKDGVYTATQAQIDTYGRLAAMRETKKDADGNEIAGQFVYGGEFLSGRQAIESNLLGSKKGEMARGDKSAILSGARASELSRYSPKELVKLLNAQTAKSHPELIERIMASDSAGDLESKMARDRALRSTVMEHGIGMEVNGTIKNPQKMGRVLDAKPEFLLSTMTSPMAGAGKQDLQKMLKKNPAAVSKAIAGAKKRLKKNPNDTQGKQIIANLAVIFEGSNDGQINGMEDKLFKQTKEFLPPSVTDSYTERATQRKDPKSMIKNFESEIPDLLDQINSVEGSVGGVAGAAGEWVGTTTEPVTKTVKKVAGGVAGAVGAVSSPVIKGTKAVVRGSANIASGAARGTVNLAKAGARGAESSMRTGSAQRKAKRFAKKGRDAMWTLQDQMLAQDESTEEGRKKIDELNSQIDQIQSAIDSMNDRLK
ncbi:MAG: hypothetical protein ABIH21_04660 [Patescibacteria group bacterium]